MEHPAAVRILAELVFGIVVHIERALFIYLCIRFLIPFGHPHKILKKDLPDFLDRHAAKRHACVEVKLVLPVTECHGVACGSDADHMRKLEVEISKPRDMDAQMRSAQ